MNAHQKIIKDNVRSILKIITNHYGVKYSAALYLNIERTPGFSQFPFFPIYIAQNGQR